MGNLGFGNLSGNLIDLVIDGLASLVRGAGAIVSEQSDALRARATKFALNVMRFVDGLPREDHAQYLGRQLSRSANSVAANYRSACRARSRAEFVSRMGVVAEESDESAHWLDMLAARGHAANFSAQQLRTEAHELEAIFSASHHTARRNLRQHRG